MKTKLLLEMYLLTIRISNLVSLSSEEATELALLDKLQYQDAYDARIRPNFPDGAVNISTSFSIVAIDNLDLTNMDYVIGFYLYLEWKDERLKHKHKKSIHVDESLRDKIWLPDTYIVNSKKANFHKVTVDNREIQVYADGTIHQRLRLTAKLSCPVDLRIFPWDVQHCPIVFESYGYSNKDVDYTWKKKAINDNQYASKITDMSQYVLNKVELKKKKTEYAIGNWSTLTAIFHLKRVNGFFMIQTLGPSAITVCISWITFIIEPSHHPARIGLGITSVLTMEAIQVFMQSSLPKVSYVKVLDVYIVASCLFVYMALAEYAIVLMFNEKSKVNKCRKRKKEKLKIKNREQKGDKENRTKCRRISRFLKYMFDSCKIHINQNSGEKMDKLSRKLFPLFFLFFNFGFWVYIRSLVNSIHP